MISIWIGCYFGALQIWTLKNGNRRILGMTAVVITYFFLQVSKALPLKIIVFSHFLNLMRTGWNLIRSKAESQGLLNQKMSSFSDFVLLIMRIYKYTTLYYPVSWNLGETGAQWRTGAQRYFNLNLNLNLRITIIAVLNKDHMITHWRH